MSEDFLHFLWKSRLYRNGLTTLDGDPVEVIDCGQHNTDSGPDFFNARVRIGPTTWAGNIEIHVRGADWNAHGHQHDQAYRNIILHVVYEAGRNSRQAGHAVPVVELKNHIATESMNKYRYLKNSKSPIPCERLIGQVDGITVSHWLQRMYVERLEAKTALAERLILLDKVGWEEAFYRLLARNFGFRLNADPFERLARMLPLKYINRQKADLLQVEALLFGMAGMLEKDFEDDYPRALKAEFRFLKNKYGLEPIDGHVWKFAKSRPMNFPTIRIAQFAMLMHRREHLFNEVLEAASPEVMKSLFAVSPSEYWIGHYRFDAVSRKTEKKTGTESIDNIIINTIAPFLFYYGRSKNHESPERRGMELLESLPPESNAITRIWKKLGVGARNAFDSQALIQLKNAYCNEKKCLQCGIGTSLVKAGGRFARGRQQPQAQPIQPDHD